MKKLIAFAIYIFPITIIFSAFYALPVHAFDDISIKAYVTSPTSFVVEGKIKKTDLQAFDLYYSPNANFSNATVKAILYSGSFIPGIEHPTPDLFRVSVTGLTEKGKYYAKIASSGLSPAQHSDPIMIDLSSTPTTAPQTTMPIELQITNVSFESFVVRGTILQNKDNFDIFYSTNPNPKLGSGSVNGIKIDGKWVAGVEHTTDNKSFSTLIKVPAVGGRTYYIGAVSGNSQYSKIVSATLPPSYDKVDCTDPKNKDSSNCNDVYTLLAPLGKPGSGLTQVDATTTFADYFKYIIRFVMGFGGVLAVIMIVIGGIQWMGTESIFSKNEGKARIKNAIFGLVLMLGAYTLLNTINPQLVDIHIGFKKVGIVDEPYKPTSGGGEKGTSNITSNITTYDNFLKTASAANGLQCTTLKAFMYTESAGNPNAVSSSGAIGLIQLMPATAAQYGVNNPTDLKDPQKNINTAGKFLGYLNKKACNNSASNTVCNVQDSKYVYAAYNGGPGSNKPSENCPGNTWWQCTENKGYQQTRDYVNKIANNKKKLTDNNWGC